MHNVGNTKIYKMNDCDWYAATCLADAIIALKEYTGASDLDEFLDEPRQLTEREMDTTRYQDDCGSETTFREELERRLVMGYKFPQFFASTEQ